MKVVPILIVSFFALAIQGFSSCPDQDYGVYIDTVSPGVVDVILYRYGPNSVGLEKFNPDTTELSKWRNTFRFVEIRSVTENQLKSVIQAKSDSAKTIVLASLDSITVSKPKNMDSILTTHWKSKQVFKGSLAKNEFSSSASLTNMERFKKQGLLSLKGKQVALFLQKGTDSLSALPVAEQDGPCRYGSSSFVVEQGRVSRTGFYWLGLPGVSLDFSTLMQSVVSVKSPSIPALKLNIRPIATGLNIFHQGLERAEYRVKIFNSQGIAVDIFRISPKASYVWSPPKKVPGIYHLEITSIPAGKIHKRTEFQKILLW
jgi:hypothetical protein